MNPAETQAQLQLSKVVRHARSVVFQMAEVTVPRKLFAAVLERIQRLREGGLAVLMVLAACAASVEAQSEPPGCVTTCTPTYIYPDPANPDKMTECCLGPDPSPDIPNVYPSKEGLS